MSTTDWATLRAAEAAQPYWTDLQSFVSAERRAHTVYPPADEVFAAFDLTPFDDVRVVILGQDPYHGDDQAHGLAFSVRHGVRVPPSLRNIHIEMRDDVGVAVPDHGSLEAWARQGVLLLNTSLTVRAHEAGSHAGVGWERFTDAVIDALAARPTPMVFVLWGNHARKKQPRISATGQAHAVIESAHPSPLSARRGFFGSRPFSAIDAALEAMGHEAIDWDLTAHSGSSATT